jgi:hypothetical protein
VKVIASAAAANPASESELPRLAEAESLSGLAHRLRAGCGPRSQTRSPAPRRSAVVAGSGTGPTPGARFRLEAVLCPDAGAVVLAALEPHQARIFAGARRQGPPGAV